MHQQGLTNQVRASCKVVGLQTNMMRTRELSKFMEITGRRWQPLLEHEMCVQKLCILISVCDERQIRQLQKKNGRIPQLRSGMEPMGIGKPRLTKPERNFSIFADGCASNEKAVQRAAASMRAQRRAENGGMMTVNHIRAIQWRSIEGRRW